MNKFDRQMVQVAFLKRFDKKSKRLFMVLGILGIIFLSAEFIIVPLSVFTLPPEISQKETVVFSKGTVTDTDTAVIAHGVLINKSNKKIKSVKIIASFTLSGGAVSDVYIIDMGDFAPGEVKSVNKTLRVTGIAEKVYKASISSEKGEVFPFYIIGIILLAAGVIMIISAVVVMSANIKNGRQNAVTASEAYSGPKNKVNRERANEEYLRIEDMLRKTNKAPVRNFFEQDISQAVEIMADLNFVTALSENRVYPEKAKIYGEITRYFIKYYGLDSLSQECRAEILKTLYARVAVSGKKILAERNKICCSGDWREALRAAVKENDFSDAETELCYFYSLLLSGSFSKDTADLFKARRLYSEELKSITANRGGVPA